MNETISWGVPPRSSLNSAPCSATAWSGRRGRRNSHAECDWPPSDDTHWSATAPPTSPAKRSALFSAGMLATSSWSAGIGKPYQDLVQVRTSLEILLLLFFFSQSRVAEGTINDLQYGRPLPSNTTGRGLGPPRGARCVREGRSTRASTPASRVLVNWFFLNCQTHHCTVASFDGVVRCRMAAHTPSASAATPVT